MKGDLENKLSEILDDADLSRDERLLQLSKAILQHGPKKTTGWSDYLRRLADYIDSRPLPVELSAKAIGGLLELEGFK